MAKLSCAWKSFTLLSWTANYCHFLSAIMHITVWFNLVHDSEGNAPFSQAVLTQALPLSCQLLKLEFWGQYLWDVLIHIPSNKTSVHTAHREWTLPALLHINKRVCHSFSFKLILNPTDYSALPGRQSHLTKTSAEVPWLAQLCSIQAVQVHGAIELHVLWSLKIKAQWLVISIMVNDKVIGKEGLERSMGRKFLL